MTTRSLLTMAVSEHKDVYQGKGEFPSSLVGIREARLWLQEQLRVQGLERSAIEAFAVSVAELATNLVDHAVPAPPAFTLQLTVGNGRIRVDLVADTHSFRDAASFRSRLRQHAPDDILPERGRGLLMVGYYFPDADYVPAVDAHSGERYVLTHRAVG